VNFLLPRLRTEIDELRSEYPSAIENEQPDGAVHLIIPDIPFPIAWEPSRIRVLLVVPSAYPTAKPVFYTEPSVKMKAVAQVGGKSGLTRIGDSDWCTYCWNPSVWDLSRETLLRFLKFSLSRFEELK